MSTSKLAPECHTAPSPSTASTASSCSSGGSPTPLDDVLTPSPSFPHLCGPLSPPLRHHTSFPSYLTPRSSAPAPTASTPESRSSRGSSKRARSHVLKRPKLPRCLRFHRRSPFRPASWQVPSSRVHDEEGNRASCVSIGSVGNGGAFASPLGKNRSFGTVLLHEQHQDLDLFRDEAEYSDYLIARLTGKHAEVDGVVFYEIELHLSRMRWTVMRRFSEFRELRQQLLKHFGRRLRAFGANGLCCAICENILQSIESTAFPSRRQDPPASLTHLLSSVSSGLRRTWTSPSSSSTAPASTPASFCDSSRSVRCPLSSSTASVASLSSSTWPSLSARHIIAVETRKGMLQDFVGDCLLTVRSLRQHFQVLPEPCAAACEISVALRLIEEFLGLSFTRYLNFLSERGVDVEP